jgi:hypothetical protein
MYRVFSLGSSCAITGATELAKAASRDPINIALISSGAAIVAFELFFILNLLY